MMAEMARLEAEIVKVCADDEELEGVADEARELNERLEVFDEELEDILDDITNSEVGEKRETLKEDAKKLIGEYLKVLDAGFFQDVDDKNGFVNVSVSRSAREGLKEVSATLV